MVLTMLQVFKKHIDCFDFTKEPDWQDSAEARQMCYERQQEREQAANEYVSSVLAGNDNWAADINEDANELALSFQRILNKAEREAYKDAAEQFLLNVKRLLREHRVKQLSPITRYRMGIEEFSTMNVVTGLSRDEAAREYQRMKKQGFAKVYYFPTEAFPAVFTVLGYMPKGRKPHEQQKNAHSDTNSTGMGNSVTDGSETAPTAGQESGTNEPNKERKKPGAKETAFEDFIVNSEETESVLTTITNNIKPNNPAQAARLICGAIEAGKLSSEVTSTSIERKFGVVAASIKPHLRKYRDGGYYKDKDLKPYKDLFKA